MNFSWLKCKFFSIWHVLNSFANESISFNAMEKQTPGPQGFLGSGGLATYFQGAGEHWYYFRGAGEQAHSFVELENPDKVKNKY